MEGRRGGSGGCGRGGAYYKELYGNKRGGGGGGGGGGQRREEKPRQQQEHEEEEEDQNQGEDVVEAKTSDMRHRSERELMDLAMRLNNAPYNHLRDLQGCYWWIGRDGVCVSFDRIQPDPHAPPSAVRLVIPASLMGYPEDLCSTPLRRTALCDFVLRVIHAQLLAEGGVLRILSPSAEVVATSAVVFLPQNKFEIRFEAPLPGQHGRRIDGRALQQLISTLPMVERRARFANLDAVALRLHICCVEDQEALREQLYQRNLFGFVGNGSVLPRKSGDSDAPLLEGAVAFSSDPSLSVTLHCPNRGPVVGMGIPVGVTVIVGGGYHGKSTLLRALEMGVYNHRVGDGRELVVCRRNAVKIRAEDGRSINGVNISAFLRSSSLPFSKDTLSFSTTCASGSTSQAASVMEALEARCDGLLIDEDTSATNFMIRDSLMSQLVSGNDEPISPFVFHVKSLAEQGIPTCLVMGGSGQYLQVAQTVIQMKNYKPYNVTAKAHALLGESMKEHLQQPLADALKLPIPLRFPVRRVSGKSERGRVRVAARDTRSMQYGEQFVDIAGVEQLADKHMAYTIGHCMSYMFDSLPNNNNDMSLVELAARVEELLGGELGLDVLSSYRSPDGYFKRPRMIDVLACLNRHRLLQTRKLKN